MESSKIFCEFYPQNAGIFVLKSLNFRIESQGRLFEVEMRNRSDREIALKLKNSSSVCVMLDSVAAIAVCGKGSKNKYIYFTDRRCDILCNFSTERDIVLKWHLKGDEFIEVSRGNFVNRRHIRKTDSRGNVLVTCKNSSGENMEMKFPVSRSKKTMVAKTIRDNSATVQKPLEADFGNETE